MAWDSIGLSFWNITPQQRGEAARELTSHKRSDESGVAFRRVWGGAFTKLISLHTGKKLSHVWLFLF